MIDFFKSEGGIHLASASPGSVGCEMKAPALMHRLRSPRSVGVCSHVNFRAVTYRQRYLSKKPKLGKCMTRAYQEVSGRLGWRQARLFPGRARAQHARTIATVGNPQVPAVGYRETSGRSRAHCDEAEIFVLAHRLILRSSENT